MANWEVWYHEASDRIILTIELDGEYYYEFVRQEYTRVRKAPESYGMTFLGNL